MSVNVNTNKAALILFGPCLQKTNISDSIKKQLLKRGKKNFLDARKSLAGHIDKELFYSRIDREWFADKIRDHFLEYLKTAQQFYNKALAKTVVLESLWINYMKAGDSNPIHTHSHDLSFIIFLQVPEKIRKENLKFIGGDYGPGCICFINEVKKDKLTIDKYTIFPEENDFYIFPSTLHHLVSPFKSKCERISVSGNISFRN